MTRYLLWGVALFFLADHKDDNGIELNFDVLIKNRVVGSLTASQLTIGSKTFYNSSTHIQTRLITEVRVDYNYSVAFMEEELEEAIVEITVNDKSHSMTHTLHNKNEYHIIKDNKPETAFNQTISYSTILLYFREPISVDQCYSEQDGSMNRLVDLGGHVYKKINSKNKENLYYYQNGALQKATIDSGIIQLELSAHD